jgi:hypothetical protein
MITSVIVGIVSGRSWGSITGKVAARFSALRADAFALVACFQFLFRAAFP